MSREKVEIVARIYECLNPDDWDAAFRDVHKDVEVETQLTGSFRGRSELRRSYEDQAAALSTSASSRMRSSTPEIKSWLRLESVRNHAAAPLRSKLG